MCRNGHTCEELAAIHGLSSPTQASKACNPAHDKVALEMAIDSRKTMLDIADRMERIPHQDLHAARLRMAMLLDEAIEREAARRCNRIGKVTQT